MGKKKVSKERAIIVKIMLAIIMLIAPISNTFGYFTGQLPVLYIISIVCVIGFFIVEYIAEK
ncbi:hypothetical protein [Bacillus sp. FSL K6-3431]|uniref:hypothetical protein n=1 Tax=Bacillus sp. FSL K6-3431 TaxID=2921500 RepID=UPI0030F6DE7F